jgi:hypothetical protein
MNRKDRGVSRTLDDDHERAWYAAHDAENRYLAAVKKRAIPEELTALAQCAQDRWTAVSRMCALAVDSSRVRCEVLPIRHRQRALVEALDDMRNWSVLGEDAAARSEFCGALASAHRPGPRNVIRLDAVDGADAVDPWRPDPVSTDPNEMESAVGG